MSLPLPYIVILFFSNDTATTEIYTLSLHDALPIWSVTLSGDLYSLMSRRISLSLPPKRYSASALASSVLPTPVGPTKKRDRKSTRLNSSHVEISYAVFCLKKKKNKEKRIIQTIAKT